MNTLASLVDNLNSVKASSAGILHTMLPIMIKMEQPTNDILADIKLELKGVPDEEIICKLQDICLELIRDAQIIRKEIDIFALSATTHAGVESKIKECPYMTKVWFGDFYEECEGAKSIVKLKEDLYLNLKNCNEDWIIDNCVLSLKK